MLLLAFHLLLVAALRLRLMRRLLRWLLVLRRLLVCIRRSLLRLLRLLRGAAGVRRPPGSRGAGGDRVLHALQPGHGEANAACASPRSSPSTALARCLLLRCGCPRVG